VPEVNASQRQRLKAAVDEARREDLDRRGGYTAQEISARADDRRAQPLTEKQLLYRIARLEDALELSRKREENARKTIKRTQAALSVARRNIELWKMRYERVKSERRAAA
jgi:hypothetical protein